MLSTANLVSLNTREKNELDEAEENSTVLDGENVVFHCILHDDQEFLLKILSDQHNAYHEKALSLLNARNSEGKSPLDMACMLGRVIILRFLIKYGADLSICTSSGYFPAHFAASWGHRDCLEVLLENGFRFDAVTKIGESPKQLALRYSHNHCVEFMDWAETDYEAQAKKNQVDKKKSHHQKKKKH